MESTPRVLVCRHGTSVLVRVEGRGEADLCPALRSFCEQALSGPCTEVLIDLGECLYFDSTFLGTLLHLRKCPGREHSAVAVARPSAKCRELLQRMGVSRLFAVVDGLPDEEDADWVPLSELRDGRGSLEFRRNVVDAHQELANVDGPLGERYRMIAELAAQDLEAAQRR